MTVLSFEVGGRSVSKGSLTSYGPGRIVEAVAGSVEWRAEVAWAASRAAKEAQWVPILRPRPARLVVVFSFARVGRAAYPTTRATFDTDKLLRNVCDALQDARVIEDDSQVIDLHGMKRWASEAVGPGAWIELSALS